MLWYEGTGTGQRRWADLDERGSTTRISNDAGATLWINTYDEYGIPGAGNGGRFQYTGQAWLPSLGMYNYKARIYSPTLGRFLQTDPIGYGDGMNWHDYVGGDPVNRRDPTGLAGTLKKDNHADFHDAWEPEIIVTGKRPAPPPPPPPPPSVTGIMSISITSPALGNTTQLSVGGGQTGGSNSPKKPTPKTKNKYNPDINYCGGKGGASFPNQNINQACYNHDVCYDRSGTPRSTCDLIFSVEVFIGRLFLNSSSPVASADAALWAIIYGSAVTIRGWQYYVPKN